MRVADVHGEHAAARDLARHALDDVLAAEVGVRARAEVAAPAAVRKDGHDREPRPRGVEARRRVDAHAPVQQ